MASLSSCTLHRLAPFPLFLFFFLFVFLAFLPFLRRGARQERVSVVILHASLPLSSFFLFLILHTRAPLKRKEKGKKEKIGGCGGLAPHYQALFAFPLRRYDKIIPNPRRKRPGIVAHRHLLL